MPEAIYDGTCACGCGKHISVGAEIQHSDEFNGWVLLGHPPKVGEICPRCFMQKSVTGVCGNCDE